MIQNDRPLRAALKELADSYDYTNGTWKHSSYELQKVALSVKNRVWSKEFNQALTRSIQRRINRRYPTTAIRQNSGHCTQHFAENAVACIQRYLRKGINHISAKKYAYMRNCIINLNDI